MWASDLGEVLEAAAHQRVRTALIGHLHRVLDQPQQLHRHLMDVHDPAEDVLHVLQEQSGLHNIPCADSEWLNSAICAIIAIYI